MREAPMNKIIILILFSLVVFSSCSRNFYCKRCPPVVKDSIVQVVKDSIVHHDSIVYTPADTVTITDTVPCQDFKKEFHGDRSYIKVVVKDSIMTAECICEAIETKLRWYEYWHKEILKSYHSELRTIYEKRLKTGFARFKDWWFYVTAIIIVFLVVRRVLKLLGKWPFPLKI